MNYKKERMEVFYKFLRKCDGIFPSHRNFKNIFLSSLTPVTDLFDIPDDDKYIFLSDKDFATGIQNVYNKDKFKMINKLKDRDKEVNVAYKEDVKNSNYIKKLREKALRVDFNKHDFDEQFTKYSKQTKIRNKDNNCNKSFTHGISAEEEEWCYLSENENSKKVQGEFITNNFQSKLELMLYYTEFFLDVKSKLIKRKFIDKANEIKKKPFDIIERYNKEYRKKQTEILGFIKKKKMKVMLEKKIQHPEKYELEEKTIMMMRRLIEHLGIINVEREDNILDFMIKYKKNDDLKFVKKNQSAYDNSYFHLSREIDKVYPNLFHFNIPKLLKLYPQLDRKELYELFIQFKVLMKLCLKNKSLEMINSGIDFPTFWKGVPQMNGESEDLVLKIFNVINERKNNFLSLEEFLNGMAQIRQTDIAKKIDMFFKIIDDNGNGLLSFDEVYDISLMSLGRTIRTDDEEENKIIKDLAYYFADLIFTLVEIDVKDEIPLQKIKETILLGGKEAEYLQMFLCADWLKKKENFSFK